MTPQADDLGRRRLAATGKKSATWGEAAWELPPGPQAAGAARAVLGGWLAGLGVDPDGKTADGILLAASEVAANAGVHGWPPVILTAFATFTGDGQQVIVSVEDANPGLPRQRQAGDLDENGRGMAIVGAITDWTETTAGPDGKRVRFGITVTGPAAAGRAGGGGDRRLDPFGMTGLGLPGITGRQVLAS